MKTIYDEFIERIENGDIEKYNDIISYLKTIQGVTNYTEMTLIGKISLSFTEQDYVGYLISFLDVLFYIGILYTTPNNNIMITKHIHNITVYDMVFIIENNRKMNTNDINLDSYMRKKKIKKLRSC
jgi:hypothetical protein